MIFILLAALVLPIGLLLDYGGAQTVNTVAGTGEIGWQVRPSIIMAVEPWNGHRLKLMIETNEYRTAPERRPSSAVRRLCSATVMAASWCWTRLGTACGGWSRISARAAATR